MRAFLFAALTAIAVIGGAPAQAAAPCAPFTTFPLTLNFGTGVNTGTGEDLNCVTKKIQAAVNALPALKGQAGGFASLDTLGFLPLGQLPTSISGLPALVAANTAGLSTLGTTVAGNTSAIGTLNAKLGAASGIATLGSDGILTAAQRPPNSGGSTAPRVPAAISTGASDNSPAINTALASVASNPGGIITLACGQYRINGNISIPDWTTLEGGGHGCTVLIVATTFRTGDVISMPGNHSTLRGVKILAESTSGEASAGTIPFRTAGYTVNMSGPKTAVTDSTFEMCFICIKMGTTGESALVRDVDMRYIAPESGAAGSGAILVDNPQIGPDNWIQRVTMAGIPGRYATFGIQIYNSGATHILDSDLQLFMTDLLINPGAGGNRNIDGRATVQATLVSGTYFDSAQGYGISIAPLGTGYVFSAHFVNCWITNTQSTTATGVPNIAMNLNGGSTPGANTVPILDISWLSGFMMSSRGQTGFGVLVNPGVYKTHIASSYIGGYGTGVQVGNNVTGGVHIANNPGIGGSNPFAFSGANPGGNGTGVALGTGANNVMVTGNDLTGNSSGALADASTASNVLITNNLGINTR